MSQMLLTANLDGHSHLTARIPVPGAPCKQCIACRPQPTCQQAANSSMFTRQEVAPPHSSATTTLLASTAKAGLACMKTAACHGRPHATTTLTIKWADRMDALHGTAL